MQHLLLSVYATKVYCLCDFYSMPWLSIVRVMCKLFALDILCQDDRTQSCREKAKDEASVLCELKGAHKSL